MSLSFPVPGLGRDVTWEAKRNAHQMAGLAQQKVASTHDSLQNFRDDLGREARAPSYDGGAAARDQFGGAHSSFDDDVEREVAALEAQLMARAGLGPPRSSAGLSDALPKSVYSEPGASFRSGGSYGGGAGLAGKAYPSPGGNNRDDSAAGGSAAGLGRTGGSPSWEAALPKGADNNRRTYPAPSSSASLPPPEPTMPTTHQQQPDGIWSQLDALGSHRRPGDGGPANGIGGVGPGGGSGGAGIGKGRGLRGMWGEAEPGALPPQRAQRHGPGLSGLWGGADDEA
ncbi:unnamed protein product, partial [Phaeothamnion confervicola]